MRVRLLRSLGLLWGLGLALSPCRADPEIMVHEMEVAERGEVLAALHANSTLKGDRLRADGSWPTDKLSFLMAEFATGIAPGWEVGIHLPAMRAGIESGNARRGEWGGSALMFRLKHITRLENGFFYGFNAEYDMNARRFVAEARSIEARAIAGYDGAHFRLAANPHLIWGFGPDLAPAPDFNVDWKVLHKLAWNFAWGAELYSDWGKLNDLRPGRGDRTLYWVAEFNAPIGALHFGVGRGFKETPEHRVVKAVWALDF